MTVPERPRLQSRNLTTELTLMSNNAAGQQVAEKTAHGLTCNLDGMESRVAPRRDESKIAAPTTSCSTRPGEG